MDLSYKEKYLMYKQQCEEQTKRLEVLEKENKELKEQHEKDFEVLVKQAYLLNNKHIDKPIIELYKLENEKLKKFVSHFKRDIEIGLSSDYRHGDSIIFDRLLSEFGKQFLKEVLGNA